MQRFTSDVDCMIAVEDEAAMTAALDRGGYKRFERFPSFARYKHEDFRLPELDVMIVDAGTFAKIWAERVEFPRLGLMHHVPTPLHLVALKLHAIKNNPLRRDQDFMDVINLLRARPVDLDALRATCQRYGPAGMFEDIQRALQR